MPHDIVPLKRALISVSDKTGLIDFARALADAGAALVVPESVLDAETLMRDIRAILTDAPRATNMAAAACTLGRPDAARHLADLVTELSR